MKPEKELPVFDLTKKAEVKKIPRNLVFEVNELGWKVNREKLKKGKCVVLFCSRKRTGRKCYCAMHAKRRDKIKYPEAYYYHNLKRNVKSRPNVSFTITLQEFKDWCKEVDLVGAKNSAERRYWSIDRIINELGYAKGNLQLIPTNDNVQKAWDEDYEEHPAVKTQFKKKEPVATEPVADDSEVPF